MSLSDVHRRLADLIDRVEASDVRVTAASPEDDATDGTVTAELTVELSVEGDRKQGTTAGDATPTSDVAAAEGDDSAATETEDDEEPPADDTDEPASDGGTGDSSDAPSAEISETASPSVPCKHGDCDATFETPHGMKIHYTKTHVGSDAAVPAYRDPERLREAYEAHDTLTEVREALDADVAVTTIRRHLLDHGIHDPDTDESRGLDSVAEPTGEVGAADATAAGATAVEDEPAPTDDAELEPADDTEKSAEPADDPVFDSETEVAPGVTVEAFREALHGAATVSGVQRSLDLDRETTVELLREYDLLDVVGGRVASKPDHETVRAEVDDRLRSRLTA